MIQLKMVIISCAVNFTHNVYTMLFTIVLRHVLTYQIGMLTLNESIDDKELYSNDYLGTVLMSPDSHTNVFYR